MKLPARITAAVSAGVVAAAMLPSSAAFALGNNRTVSRSCGSNYIASGWTGTQAWAQTHKNGGSCAGALGAAIQLSNGVRTPRMNGTTSEAEARYNTRLRPQNGVHWGCLACAATLS